MNGYSGEPDKGEFFKHSGVEPERSELESNKVNLAY